MANVDLTEFLNRSMGKKMSIKEKGYFFYFLTNLFSILFVAMDYMLLFITLKPLLPITKNISLYFRESYLAWLLSDIAFLNHLGSIILSVPLLFGYIYMLKNFKPLSYKIYSHGRFIFFVIFDLGLIGFAIFISIHYFLK